LESDDRCLALGVGIRDEGLGVREWLCSDLLES
jgi:hypothetical protein